MENTVVDKVYALKQMIGKGGMAEVYLAEVDLAHFDYGLLYAYTQVHGQTHTERRKKAEELCSKLSGKKLDPGTIRAILEAHDIPLPDHTVAVKLAKTEADKLRFEAEWKNLLCLNHDNVIKVYGGGAHGDRQYYSMQYIDNIISPETLVNELALAQKLDIVTQGGRGLGYLHRNGIVHRDVKLDNLVTRRGKDDKLEVKIADLGIAKNVDDEMDLTVTNTFMGTPSYMAPEQFSSAKSVDRQADIYSLGAVLYTLITGVRPYHEKETVYELIHAVGRGEPPTPSNRVRPDIPEALALIIQCAMAWVREDRYLTMEELVQDLEMLGHELGGDPSATSEGQYMFEKYTRRPPPDAPAPPPVSSDTPPTAVIATETPTIITREEQKSEPEPPRRPSERRVQTDRVDTQMMTGPQQVEADYTFSTFAHDMAKYLGSPKREQVLKAIANASEAEMKVAVKKMIPLFARENRSDIAWKCVQKAYIVGPPPVRTFCLQLLPELLETDREIVILQKLLGDPEASVRCLVLARLSALKAESAAPLMARFLNDPEERVQAAVLKALEPFPLLRIIEPVTQFCVRRQLSLPESVRKRLKTETPQIQSEALNRLAKHGNAQVRVRVTRLLAEIPGTLSTNLLNALLHDRHPLVRAEAARAIGACQNKKLLEAMFQALADANSIAQEGVIEGLMRFPLTPAAAVLLESLGRRQTRINGDIIRFLWHLNGDPHAVRAQLEGMRALPETPRKCLYLLLTHALADGSLEEILALLQSAEDGDRRAGAQKALAAIKAAYQRRHKPPSRNATP